MNPDCRNFVVCAGTQPVVFSSSLTMQAVLLSRRRSDLEKLVRRMALRRQLASLSWADSVSGRGKCDTSPEQKAAESFARRHRIAPQRSPYRAAVNADIGPVRIAFRDLPTLCGTVSQTYHVSRRLRTFWATASPNSKHIEARHPRSFRV